MPKGGKVASLGDNKPGCKTIQTRSNSRRRGVRRDASSPDGDRNANARNRTACHLSLGVPSPSGSRSSWVNASRMSQFSRSGR
jgi:hypothetical protein